MNSTMLAYKDSVECFSAMIAGNSAEASVYRNNTIGIHGGALKIIFPVTRHVLGAHVFAALAQVYSTHYPAKQWDINRYGDGFAEFLRAQLLCKKACDYPWKLLARIAEIEHAISRCYYADEESDDRMILLWENMQHIAQAQYLELLSRYHPYCNIADNCVLAERICIRQQQLFVEIFNTVPAQI